MLIKLTRPVIKDGNVEAASLQRLKALEQQISGLSAEIEELRKEGVSIRTGPYGTPKDKKEEDSGKRSPGAADGGRAASDFGGNSVHLSKKP